MSARRRDERLSTLRLLGVSPAGVTVATVTESVFVAAAGALVGVIAHIAMSPLIGLIPFRGEPLGFTAVLLPPLQIALVFVGVLMVSATSAVVGLRRVVISPLGVRTRTDVTKVHWLRAVFAAGAVAIAFVLIKVFPSIGGLVTTIVVVAALFGAVLAVLNLVGPWVLKVSASRQLRRAERPDRLLAARIGLDSPKAAWRQVGGIAMASFMAVFAGTGVALMNVMTGPEASSTDFALAQDIRTGLIITLIGSFLMVAASVGVNQASDVLDQRELHRSLHHLGMPLETVDHARRRAIMSPLLVTAIGSALVAAVLVFPLVGLALITAPASLITIALIVAIGVGVVWASTWATRPLLHGAFRTA
ncbi:FtsX-like permease family protein [Microbacterium sp. Se63.02b]|uniref:FtsX-like permease family protein n=1 Tax=Microbacterium sp. Se63.02b TaxID=2709304 RepID=UPI001FCE3F03|nr:FtsX-like permease family protein [Microbacterium sp. Se63.02b]